MLVDQAPCEADDQGVDYDLDRDGLLRLVRGGCGRVDPALLIDHVLEIAAGEGGVLLAPALRAIAKRWASAAEDGLRVDERPAKGEVLGTYRTRRPGEGPRPYWTQVRSLRPLRICCDCPDFIHNGLGLCKHGLAVLDALYGRPRSRSRLRACITDGRALSALLSWDPVRPLAGRGDWLERVRYHAEAGPGRTSAAEKRLRKLFVARDGILCLRTPHHGRPKQRAELISTLLTPIVKQAKADSPGMDSVDVALLAQLRAEQARLQRAPQLPKRELSSHLRTLRRALYAYQRQGVERFMRQGRLLLADDMGLGKTAQATACAHVLFRSRRVRRGLLIVPASLKAQWMREWQRFSDVPIAVVEGTPEERRASYLGLKRGCLILNYEQLLRDLPSVVALNPELVVLDEAQRIKNWHTKTALYVKALQPPYRLVLTGTPLENRLEELASIMQWVDGGALEPAWRLAPLHYTEGGVRNLSTLRLRLEDSMLRRVRQEVLHQLPPRTDTVVPVALTSQQAAEHAELDQPIASLVVRSHKRALTRPEFLRLMSLLTRQRMICNGLALSSFADVWPTIQSQRPTPRVLQRLLSPKLVALRELLETLLAQHGRKVVIFSQWRRMLTLCHWAVSDVLALAGARAVFFSGTESQAQRDRNVIEFHEDPEVRVLLATDAGGVGLNLQQAASCCINLELPWNPAVLEQRIGRVHRLGQREPVEAYTLVSEAGIEARIVQLVGDKRALSRGLFDSDSDEVLFEESQGFLERMEQVIEPIEVPDHPDEPDSFATAEDEVDIGPDANIRRPESEQRVKKGTPVVVAPSAAGVKGASARTAPPSLSSLAEQVQVQIAQDGTLHLKAPPAAASQLLSLLEGLAGQLRQQIGEPNT